MLVGKGNSSLMIYNGIKDDVNIEKVIVENSGSKIDFIKRRIKRLGYWKVFGQILFQLIYVPILTYSSKKRINEIIKTNNLTNNSIEENKIVEVSSVNSKECIDNIIKINPDFIIVNGTKIISKKVLNCTNAIFVNMHSGITPKYRGVHGAYWALANNDLDNCGVTVHLVDPGIDTGGIINQNKIQVTAKDNFVTYPYLQMVEGIKLLKKSLIDLQSKKFKIIKRSEMSKLWYHPTLWHYLFLKLTKGVK